MFVYLGMVNSTTPKLEDFFGGATMGAHNFEPSLSLDSLYNFHQTEENQPNNNNVQEYPNYPSFRGSQEEMYQESHEAKEASHCGNGLQLPTMSADDGMKSWVLARNYQDGHHHALEDKMGISVEEGGGSMGYGDLKSLTLSMSPGSQSSCVAPVMAHECMAIVETKKRGVEKVDQQQKQIVHRKSIDTFGQRTSQYRGVTRFDLFCFM